jgi:hypothetical protein
MPTHSCPLKPSGANLGPKSAGLARKKVELSSVKLMIADDGKSVEGARKEKKARRRPLPSISADSVASGPCGGWEYRSEKKVRKVGRARKQRKNRISRAGPMFATRGGEW